jgi:hypothetical protein
MSLLHNQDFCSFLLWSLHHSVVYCGDGNRDSDIIHAVSHFSMELGLFRHNSNDNLVVLIFTIQVYF